MYKMLLPSSAYVVKFIATIEDKVVTAVVKEEEQAIEVFFICFHQ